MTDASPLEYSSTVEKYIKQLYLLSEDGTKRLVSMKRLVTAVGVAPGTATSMVKTLADQDLVEYLPREGARLTEKGIRLAIDLVRKHRLVELFLVKILKLDWSEVHREAEELEHVVSPRIVERIDEALGFPRYGPHGKPIPDDSGNVESASYLYLDGVPDGSRVTITQIEDDDTDLLRLVGDRRYSIGTVATIERDGAAGTVTLKREGDNFGLTLSLRAAAAVGVAPVADIAGRIEARAIEE